MKYQKTVIAYLKENPLCLDRLNVDNFLFVTNWNGYVWENGEIIQTMLIEGDVVDGDVVELPSKKKLWHRYDNYVPTFLEPGRISMLNSFKEENKVPTDEDIEYMKNCAHDEDIITENYNWQLSPITEDSLMMQIPDDITEDWLAAICRFVHFCLSYQYYIHVNKEVVSNEFLDQVALLEKAQKRILSIYEERSIFKDASFGCIFENTLNKKFAFSGVFDMPDVALKRYASMINEHGELVPFDLLGHELCWKKDGDEIDDFDYMPSQYNVKRYVEPVDDEFIESLAYADYEEGLCAEDGFVKGYKAGFKKLHKKIFGI